MRKSLFGSSFLCLPLPVRLIRSSFCHGKREKQKHHGLKEKEIGSRFFAALPSIFSKSHEAACFSKVRHIFFGVHELQHFSSTDRINFASTTSWLLFSFCVLFCLLSLPHTPCGSAGDPEPQGKETEGKKSNPLWFAQCSSFVVAVFRLFGAKRPFEVRRDVANVMRVSLSREKMH